MPGHSDRGSSEADPLIAMCRRTEPSIRTGSPLPTRRESSARRMTMREPCRTGERTGAPCPGSALKSQWGALPYLHRPSTTSPQAVRSGP
jgi:hypothetical protein